MSTLVLEEGHYDRAFVLSDKFGSNGRAERLLASSPDIEAVKSALASPSAPIQQSLSRSKLLRRVPELIAPIQPPRDRRRPDAVVHETACAAVALDYGFESESSGETVKVAAVRAKTPSREQTPPPSATRTMTDSAISIVGSSFVERIANSVVEQRGRRDAQTFASAVFENPAAQGVIDTIAASVATIAAPTQMDDALGFSAKPTSAADADAVKTLREFVDDRRERELAQRTKELSRLHDRAATEPADSAFVPLVPLCTMAAAGALRATVVAETPSGTVAAAVISPDDHYAAHAMAARIIASASSATSDNSAPPPSIIDGTCASIDRQEAVRTAEIGSGTLQIAQITDKQREAAKESAANRLANKQRARDKAARMAAERANREKIAASAVKLNGKRKSKAGSAPAKRKRAPDAPPTSAAAPANLHNVRVFLDGQGLKTISVLGSKTLVAVLRLLSWARQVSDPRVARLLAPQFAEPVVQATHQGAVPVQNKFNAPNEFARMISGAVFADALDVSAIESGSAVGLQDYEVARAAVAFRAFVADKGYEEIDNGNAHEHFVASVLSCMFAVTGPLAETMPIPHAVVGGDKATLDNDTLPAGLLVHREHTKKFLVRMFARLCSMRLGIDFRSTTKTAGAEVFWQKFGAQEIAGEDAELWRLLHSESTWTLDERMRLATILVPIANALFVDSRSLFTH